MSNDHAKVLRGENFDTPNESGLASIRFRKEYFFKTTAGGVFDYGEYATNAPEFSREGEFSEKKPSARVKQDFVCRGKVGEGYRKIKNRAFFFYISRSQ